jgi:hypothetical protein
MSAPNARSSLTTQRESRAPNTVSASRPFGAAGHRRGATVAGVGSRRQRSIDPEAVRFYALYPRFPGVETCVELLCRLNVQGTWVECIDAQLEEHAVLGDLVEALVAVPSDERRARHMLIYQIGLRDSPEAIEFLATMVADDTGDSEERNAAVNALNSMGSAEARRALWRASHRP